jgi:hypothetical protein
MAAESAQQKVTLEQSEAASFAPVDESGVPMMMISCAATELIPTRQYANVTSGPIVVKRWIPVNFKGFTEAEVVSMKLAAKEMQVICEEAVAEDRQSLHALIRQSDGGRYTE